MFDFDHCLRAFSLEQQKVKNLENDVLAKDKDIESLKNRFREQNKLLVMKKLEINELRNMGRMESSTEPKEKNLLRLITCAPKARVYNCNLSASDNNFSPIQSPLSICPSENKL